jgi:hypothetical protein
VGFSISGDPILHLELTHIKKRSDATGDFKNYKGLAYLSLDLLYDAKGW